MNNIYDFGLIGFWYNYNYGAALNTYALSEVIKRMGYSIMVIEAPGMFYDEDDVVFAESSPVRKFISHYCNLSDKQHSRLDLIKLNDMCGGFILGSDQLWRWRVGKIKDDGAYYLLDFVASSKKKITYGTSFGEEDFIGNSEDCIMFGYLLRRFADVSVREIDAVKMCQNFGVRATWVVDPVFLLDKDEYESISKKSHMSSSICDDYIFVYLLQPTEEKNRIIKQVAALLGERVVAVSDLSKGYDKYFECCDWEFEHFSQIEIVDWIRLLQNSDYVITDSYHGFCFSIIFKKQFLALTPRDGINRFKTVAKIADLGERIDVGGVNHFDISTVADIDFEKVWNKLRPEVERSRQWLKIALEKENKLKEEEAIYDVVMYNNARIQEEYEQRFQMVRDQYYSMCCKLRKQSYITRRYIVRDYLIDRLKGKTVTIRGAGGHTDEILRILKGSDINVVCIWDKNTKADNYGGYPMINEAKDLKKYDIDTILISSWKFRKEMTDDVNHEINNIDLQNIDVVDLYEELQQKGIPIDSEYFWFDWDYPVQ